MSDFKVGDRVRRTETCTGSGCDDPCHQVGWEGEVLWASRAYLRFGDDERSGLASNYRKVEPEDKDTPEAQPYLSAAPDPAIRLAVLKLALDYGIGVQNPRETVEVAEVFAAWVEGQ